MKAVNSPYEIAGNLSALVGAVTFVTITVMSRETGLIFFRWPCLPVVFCWQGWGCFCMSATAEAGLIN